MNAPLILITAVCAWVCANAAVTLWRIRVAQRLDDARGNAGEGLGAGADGARHDNHYGADTTDVGA